MGRAPRATDALQGTRARPGVKQTNHAHTVIPGMLKKQWTQIKKTLNIHKLFPLIPASDQAESAGNETTGMGAEKASKLEKKPPWSFFRLRSHPPKPNQTIQTSSILETEANTAFARKLLLQAKRIPTTCSWLNNPQLHSSNKYSASSQKLALYIYSFYNQGFT